MKQKFKEIALQVGGSHYPDVGGDLLEKFGEMIVAECTKAVQSTDLRDITYTTFDRGRNVTIIKACMDSINQTFKE